MVVLSFQDANSCGCLEMCRHGVAPSADCIVSIRLHCENGKEHATPHLPPLDLPRRRRQSGAVNVIAVHYTPGGGEALAGPLAEALDKTPYEARARLSDPEG